MKWLLVAVLVLPLHTSEKECRDRAWRCTLRCGETTQGGSLERLRCYDRCREDEFHCKREART